MIITSKPLVSITLWGAEDCIRAAPFIGGLLLVRVRLGFPSLPVSLTPYRRQPEDPRGSARGGAERSTRVDLTLGELRSI